MKAVCVSIPPFLWAELGGTDGINGSRLERVDVQPREFLGFGPMRARCREGCNSDNCHGGFDATFDACCDALPVLRAAEDTIDPITLTRNIHVGHDLHLAD